jgi:hypothetical protein
VYATADTGFGLRYEFDADQFAAMVVIANEKEVCIFKFYKPKSDFDQIMLSQDTNTESSGDNLIDHSSNNLISVFTSLDKTQAILPKEKLEALRKYMGFNISEIASILQIQRPTVYEWLGTDNPKLRKSNRKRLNAIYEICEKWHQTRVGRLGQYVRRAIYKNKSLFDLLSEENLNYEIIYEAMGHLEKIIKDAATNKTIHKRSLNRQKNAIKMHRSIG